MSLAQEFGSGGSPSAQVIGVGQSVTSVSTAWTRYALTFTLPSTAGKTLGTDNNNQTSLEMWLSAGSSFATRTGGVGVQTGFFNMWGVQLEIGSTATPLEKPDPQVDLANCQRFFQSYPQLILSGYAPAGNTVYEDFIFATTMRAVPTIAFANVTYLNASGVGVNGAASNHMRLVATVTATNPGYSMFDATLSADL